MGCPLGDDERRHVTGERRRSIGSPLVRWGLCRLVLKAVRSADELAVLEADDARRIQAAGRMPATGHADHVIALRQR